MTSFLKLLYAAAKGRLFSPEHFAGNDLSYRIGKTVFRIGDGAKAARRGLRRWLRSPQLTRKRARVMRSIRKRDWDLARRQAVELAALAEQSGDPRLMEDVGKLLLIVSEYERSAALRFASRRLRRGNAPKEWQGDDVDGLLLINFVESEDQGMGASLKHGFLIAEAAKRAANCALVVQPRLQPLFARTFRQFDVFPFDKAEARLLSERATKIAGGEHLDFYIGKDAATIRALFKPLKADEATTKSLRKKYKAGSPKPLVGISWGSSAYAKETPPLDAWAGLIRTTDAQFVSLQYGKIEAELAELTQRSGKTIIRDGEVDQLQDMDKFAAQIAALDAVVTISNTGAHLAGALGVPMIILNDDTFRRVWPADTEHAPYYPAALVLQRRQRPWSDVMSEIGSRLAGILEQRSKA
jgi:hypothetical protein